ncbi:MAG: zf-HC2 domain-containing protein [Candidatus Methylomirabilales bacterium]
MRNEATCQETQAYLQEFMDAELVADQEERLRAHLESCPHCAGELGLQREIRSRVAAEFPRHQVPAELRQKVREIFTSREKRIWGLLPRPTLRWAMALAAVVLIGLVPLTLLNRGREERIPPILVEAVNDYLSFAMRIDPQVVPTADRQQVRQWLETKVGFQIDPPSGQGGELRLMGGDVTYFLERKVACLLYGKGAKLVTLFVLPDDGIEVPQRGFRQVNGLTLYMASHRGYGVVFWKQDKLLYSAVSELPQEELLGVLKEIVRI